MTTLILLCTTTLVSREGNDSWLCHLMGTFTFIKAKYSKLQPGICLPDIQCCITRNTTQREIMIKLQSLSRSSRDSLEYFEISVPRQIRLAELRKTVNRTTTFNKWICNSTPEVKRYFENIVEKRRNCSLGAISPLFHNILIPVVRFPC